MTKAPVAFLDWTSIVESCYKYVFYRSLMQLLAILGATAMSLSASNLAFTTLNCKFHDTSMLTGIPDSGQTPGLH